MLKRLFLALTLALAIGSLAQAQNFAGSPNDQGPLPPCLPCYGGGN